jgi:ArsR family transcriptional regulator
MEIPQGVTVELERIGGIRSICQTIPRGKYLRTLSNVFQSLSDPIRLSILYALSAAPLCVCVIKSIVRIADSKLSYHLNALKSAGLVVQQSEGRFIVYRITDLGKKIVSLSDSIK